MVDSNFIVPLDLHCNWCYNLIGRRQFMLDSISFQFASSYDRFCILVASGCASSHSLYGFFSRCTIDRIDRSLYFQFASFLGLID
jgi:hypothetical protein